MDYLSLYRKWRPQSFSEVRGQEPVVRTLQNALEQNRVAHAYLFAGPRGTGKTSTAKILAKSLNCEKGLTSSPCGDCTSCKKIKNGYAIDVIEIDAASNRGIDEIRDLREKVRFLPSEGRYKVYIIDEVHMLTTEAFNALLKTLEEPPSHVVFILATTELHKIPATILSRCQCFEFRPISLKEIGESLSQVAAEEGLEASSQALNLIARNAQGGLRDALSLLDQVIAFRGKQIEAKDVEAILGLVNQESLFRLGNLLLQKDASGIIQLVQDLINEGMDLHQFVKSSIGHFRNLLLFKVCAQPEDILAMSPEEIEELSTQALNYRKGELVRIIEVFSACESEMKWAFQARWSLEVALIKLIQPTEEDRINQLVERLSHLESILAQGDQVKLPETKIKLAKKSAKSSKEVQKVEEKTNPIAVNLSSSLAIDEVEEVWPVLLEKIKKKKRTFHAYLLEGQLLEVQGNQIILSFSPKFVFHKENAEKPEVKELVETTLEQMLKREVKLKCILENNSLELIPVEEKKQVPQEELLKDPLVKRTLELFGGKIIEIKEEGKSE